MGAPLCGFLVANESNNVAVSYTKLCNMKTTKTTNAFLGKWHYVTGWFSRKMTMCWLFSSFVNLAHIWGRGWEKKQTWIRDLLLGECWGGSKVVCCVKVVSAHTPLWNCAWVCFSWRTTTTTRSFLSGHHRILGSLGLMWFPCARASCLVSLHSLIW